MIAPIRTEQDRLTALARIDELMRAETGSAEVAELQVLAILLERYEREAFPIDAPTAIDVIRFRMEQMAYTQSDLARLLGRRSRASEIMTGPTKSLSINMIRRLRHEWRIPVEALIGRAA